MVPGTSQSPGEVNPWVIYLFPICPALLHLETQPPGWASENPTQQLRKTTWGRAFLAPQQLEKESWSALGAVVLSCPVPGSWQQPQGSTRRFPAQNGLRRTTGATQLAMLARCLLHKCPPSPLPLGSRCPYQDLQSPAGF